MIRRTAAPIALALLVAGCATTTNPSARPPAAEKPADLHEAGLERVVGRTAPQLLALFGTPDLDLREGQARRLQFVGPACVLDTYLYPDKPGATPVVTYLDARTPAGDDIDRASCVAALSRRAAAK